MSVRYLRKLKHESESVLNGLALRTRNPLMRSCTFDCGEASPAPWSYGNGAGLTALGYDKARPVCTVHSASTRRVVRLQSLPILQSSDKQRKSHGKPIVDTAVVSDGNRIG